MFNETFRRGDVVIVTADSIIVETRRDLPYAERSRLLRIAAETLT